MTQRTDQRNAPNGKWEGGQLGGPAPPSAADSRGTRNSLGVAPAGVSGALGRIACFGSFRLHTSNRVLEKNGKPLKIGSRALDILITLLEHSPAIVSKRELIERAWGNLLVDEVSLRVHMAALRKRLGDEGPRGGYITNVPGRGYCFAGDVGWTGAAATPRNPPPVSAQLPRQPLLMVGRDQVVGELAAQLETERFVSIVGAGGIGKTTIALALAHRMLSKFQGAAHFLDLATIEDSRLLARMLATQLGLVAISDQPLPVILSFLREQRMLLVFDSCEHLVEAVAALTENIFRDAPGVHILATSREALRAAGEQVHHLPPLACPPPDAESLTATQALSFPAVQLFVRQVTHSDHAVELTDEDAPIVADICRRLDGIPLALQLAASRVGAHGLRGTASMLDKHFRLLWRGRRTALPRHQTLGATLDWSYNLLSSTEQMVFRRLAVFVGDFSIEAALEVGAGELDSAEAAETLAALVEKSLVIPDGANALRYRLRDTTRAYASRKLTESCEALEITRRHCEQMLRVLEAFHVTVWAPPSPESVRFFVGDLANLRAALDWGFSDEGDTELGARLIGASACLFIQRGLLTECVSWTGRAIRALNGSGLGSRLELELQACFASSLTIATGNVPQARAALIRALEVATRHSDAPMEFYLLHALYMWQMRSGDLAGAEQLTDRVESVARQIADPFANAIAYGFRAVTCFFTADNRNVGRYAQLALDVPLRSAKLSLARFGDIHRGAKTFLALNCWFLGYPDQAVAAAAEAVQQAESLNHAFTLCYVHMSCILVAMETGDRRRAEELIHRLSSIATKHQLLTYARAALGWQGCLAISRGEMERGIELLQSGISALHEDGYELYRPWFSVRLSEGLAKSGQHELAFSTICEALTWAQSRGRILNFVELLRVKGEILNSMTRGNSGEGEACLLESLNLARERELLSLELRSGISLARLWAGRGAIHNALQLLEPVFKHFSEGFGTPDLVAAAALLHELQALR